MRCSGGPSICPVRPDRQGPARQDQAGRRRTVTLLAVGRPRSLVRGVWRMRAKFGNQPHIRRSDHIWQRSVNRRLSSTGSGMLEPSRQSRGGPGLAVGQWPSGFDAETSGRLLGGCAGAVQDACGVADVHVEGDADVGVAGHAGDVGGLQVPAEQGCGAEHVPGPGPGPGAAAAGVAPPGGQVGGRQDAAVEVGGPPVATAGGGNISPRGLAPVSCSARACWMRPAIVSASG